MTTHVHHVIAKSLTMLVAVGMTNQQIIEIVLWAMTGTKEIKTFFCKFLASHNKALERPTARSHLGKDNAARTLLARNHDVDLWVWRAAETIKLNISPKPPSHGSGFGVCGICAEYTGCQCTNCDGHTCRTCLAYLSGKGMSGCMMRCGCCMSN